MKETWQEVVSRPKNDSFDEEPVDRNFILYVSNILNVAKKSL